MHVFRWIAFLLLMASCAPACQQRAAQGAPASPPLTLTGADGRALQLQSLSARAVVEGPLALTQLHLTFDNPLAQQIEGRFSIALPDTADVVRFAVRAPAGWQEAEVGARVPDQDRIAQVDARGRFSARVSSIPARGQKEIIIGYTEELATAAQPYRLSLLGLPPVELLDLRVLVEGQAVQLTRRRHAPTEDFVVPTTGTADGVRHQNLAVVRLEIPNREVPLDGLLVLVDASTTSAAGLRQSARLVDALLSKIKDRHGVLVDLEVACFGEQVDVVYDGPLGELSSSALGRILPRGARGDDGLVNAAQHAIDRRARHPRVLLVTHAADTASAFSRLPGLVFGSDPLYVDLLVTAGIDDQSADREVERVARRLGHTNLSGLKVEVTGARWTWPGQLDGLHRGDGLLVYADLPTDGALAGRGLEVVLSGAMTFRKTVPLRGVGRPLVQRAWARAKIADLAQSRHGLFPHLDVVAALDGQAIDLSLRHRVLGARTALVIPATSADHARFGLDPRALPEILVVEEGRAEGRDGVSVFPFPRRTAPPGQPRRAWGPARPRQRRAQRLRSSRERPVFTLGRAARSCHRRRLRLTTCSSTRRVPAALTPPWASA